MLENVELPLLLAGAAQTAGAARERLRWVGLAEKAASLPYQLSGGQMQRVAIARALVHSPDLLIADEPTGNLDTASGDQVLALLREAADALRRHRPDRHPQRRSRRHRRRARPPARRPHPRHRARNEHPACSPPRMKLLRTLILRPLRRDLLRTALTILSVALGVAVVVAIDLAGDAATGSFRSSMQTLTGKTDLEILANGGIDERYMAALAALPFDVHFAPMMEAQIAAARHRLRAALRRRSRWARRPAPPSPKPSPRGSASAPVTGTLAGRPVTFPIAQTIDAAGEFVVLDIADAQQALHRYGKLDRIDVTVGRDGRFRPRRASHPRRRCRPVLIEKPGARSEENQRMLRAFRWNLRVLSYISLVVGAFLIYNTISVSVVRRRAEIGILRAIGAARSTILALFLAEALLFGVIGAALGVLLGRVLAGGAVRLIADTVNALYTTSRPAPIELTAFEVWTGILTGALVALRQRPGAGARSHAGGAHRSHEPRSARTSRAPALAARPGLVRA